MKTPTPPCPICKSDNSDPYHDAHGSRACADCGYVWHQPITAHLERRQASHAELLAALTAVMDWWSRAPMLHEDVDMPAVVVSAARAAIAKSTTKHA